MIEVINIRKAPAGWQGDSRYVYIGRKGHGFDGYFGNPFPLEQGVPRGSTLAKFREYAVGRMASDPIYKLRVEGLADKILVCFCKPAACHGDVLAELAAAQSEEKRG